MEAGTALSVDIITSTSTIAATITILILFRSEKSHYVTSGVVSISPLYWAL